MNQLAASLHLSGEWSYEAGREYHVHNTMFLKKSTSISPANIFNRKNVKLEFFLLVSIITYPQEVPAFACQSSTAGTMPSSHFDGD